MISKISVSNGAERSQLSSAEKLFSVWTARYLSKDSLAVSTYTLEESASLQGRQRTAERLRIELIEDVCKRAAIRTKDLYTHHENLDLKETAELAQFAIQIYPVLLEFYRLHAPMAAFISSENPPLKRSSLPVFAIPDIHELASRIQPFLLAFQSQDVKTINWQTRSFLTTELNLAGALLLEFLSPAEQLLLTPYFSFLEEYVAIPWQRVCIAAADYTSMSPKFELVERMLPKSSAIAAAVYTESCRLFGGYYNRRGQLDNPGVRHSSLRDLEMFQAYLWLCVLEGDLGAIEQELLVLCDLVYAGIGVPWEMAFQGVKLTVSAIMKHLDPSEQALLAPYTDGFLQAFTRG